MNFSLIPKGQFRAICPTMTLERAGALPLRIAGRGEIRQDEDRRFLAEIDLVDAAGRVAALQETFRPKGWGQPIPKDEYMELIATDDTGVRWHGKVPRMGIVGNLVHGSKASAMVVMLENSVPGANVTPVETVRCVIRGKLEFPLIDVTETHRLRLGVEVQGESKTDHTVFSAGSDSFVLSYEGDDTVLDCTFGEGGIAAFRHMRMLEALQFALGQLVNPFCWITNAGGVVKTYVWPPRTAGAPSSIMAPFVWNYDLRSRVPFEIARAYYSAILTHVGEEWHPLTRIVYKTVDAGDAATDMREVAFAIATESAIRVCYAKAGQPTPSFVNDVEQVRTKMKELTLSEEAAKRIDGSLKGLLHPRNSDRVMAFVRDKGLPEDLYALWSDMRNGAAHGRLSEDDFALRWDNLNRVLFLFHSVVFDYVGYVGPRTDYLTPARATIAWPHISPNSVEPILLP